MDMGMPSAVKLSFKLFQLIVPTCDILSVGFDKKLKKGDSYCSGKSTHYYAWKVYKNRLIHNNDVNSISIETDGK